MGFQMRFDGATETVLALSYGGQHIPVPVRTDDQSPDGALRVSYDSALVPPGAPIRLTLSKKDAKDLQTIPIVGGVARVPVPEFSKGRPLYRLLRAELAANGQPMAQSSPVRVDFYPVDDAPLAPIAPKREYDVAVMAFWAILIGGGLSLVFGTLSWMKGQTQERRDREILAEKIAALEDVQPYLDRLDDLVTEGAETEATLKVTDNSLAWMDELRRNMQHERETSRRVQRIDRGRYVDYTIPGEFLPSTVPQFLAQASFTANGEPYSLSANAEDVELPNKPGLGTAITIPGVAITYWKPDPTVFEIGTLERVRQRHADVTAAVATLEAEVDELRQSLAE